jgi:hypothetical protein
LGLGYLPVLRTGLTDTGPSISLTDQHEVPGQAGLPELAFEPARRRRQSLRRLGATAASYLSSEWRATAVAATAATLANWPVWARIRTGLDPSWQAGIAEGFTQRLQWGPQLDFTYGPYGFAPFVQPFYRLTAFIAVLYVFAVTWLLAALLVAGLRRYCRVTTAGVVAWALLALSSVVAHTAEFTSVAGLGLALAILETGSRARRAALATVLGVLAGFVLLVKLDPGVTVLGLLALAVVGTDVGWRERARIGGQAAGALVAVFMVAWAGAGQSFGNIASFIRASFSLTLGYSDAMAGRLGSVSIPRYAISALVLTACVFLAVLVGRPRRYQFVAGLMVVGWGRATLKDGFVSGNHFPAFFELVLAAIAMAGLVRPPRAVYGPALAVAACITLATSGLPVVNPLASVRAFAGELAGLAQPSRFAQLTANSRARLVRDEPLVPETLALLRGHTVAIEPWEDMVAWADPAVRWDPEPVVQSYSAYTGYTDHLDAAFLASPRAPQRILFWSLRFGFDFRDPYMEPPATMVAVYCHYVQVAVIGRWQVLARGADRCGPAVTIAMVRARFGQPVKVPGAPGKMVVASFSLQLPWRYKLRGVLLKPPDTYIEVWGRRGPPTTYRFVTDTAGDEHVVSAPAALGYSGRFDPPGSVRALEISGTGWKAGHGEITITFQVLTIARR